MIKSAEVFVSTRDLEFKLSEVGTYRLLNGEDQFNTLKLRINVDPEAKSHKFLGMGYSFEHTSCYNILALPDKEKKRAIELLVNRDKGAGMNLWRLCIGTADFTGTPWYSYLDTPPRQEEKREILKYVEKNFSIAKDKELIIPVAKKALEINPNIIFFASPWSPPGWMKDSGKMCGGHLLSEYWEAYALYLALYVEAYDEIGISIHAITIQNEPLHDVESMPSCGWDIKGKQERDFIKHHLGPMFEERGLDTEIWCFDHNWSLLGFLNLLGRPSRYPQTILDDPEARKYVDGIAFHHYAAVGFSSPKMMLKLRKKYPDIQFYFTEGSLEYFWGSMRLPRYIKHGSSSINGWVPMIGTDGSPNNGPFKTTHTMIQRKVPENLIKINFDYYMYAQYAKYIERDAQILETAMSKSRGFESVSWINPNGDIVTVITNKRNKSRDVQIRYRIQEFDSGYKTLKIGLKPHSITTIRCKNIE